MDNEQNANSEGHSGQFSTCPHCGYCEYCGRSNFQTPWNYPIYPYITWGNTTTYGNTGLMTVSGGLTPNLQGGSDEIQ